MADLQFVDFALMPGPVRKEKQFGLPDDFFRIDATILSRTRHPASTFPAVFRISQHARTARFGADPQNVLHDKREATNLPEHFRSQRDLSVIKKERSEVELNTFLAS